MKHLIYAVAFICSFATAKPSVLHLAKIQSIEQGKPINGELPVDVNFQYHCNENILQVLEITTAPYSLANPHKAIGVVLEEKDSNCDLTQVFTGKRTFIVPNIAGFYTFRPLLSLPATYSCIIFSGIPQPEGHCDSGKTEDLCNTIPGCRWLPADYEGPFPP